jgi:hypothetical protein
VGTVELQKPAWWAWPLRCLLGAVPVLGGLTALAIWQYGLLC